LQGWEILFITKKKHIQCACVPPACVVVLREICTTGVGNTFGNRKKIQCAGIPSAYIAVLWEIFSMNKKDIQCAGVS